MDDRVAKHACKGKQMEVHHLSACPVTSGSQEMLFMLMTSPTFHFDRSPLKSVEPENISRMSSTWDTFQSPIGPCDSVEQSPTEDDSKHESIASLRSSVLSSTNAVPANILCFTC